MEKKRSIGVTVFGWIMLIWSLWLIGGTLIILNEFFTSHLFHQSPNEPVFLRPLINFFSPVLILEPITFFLGLIYLALSINLLKLKNWARVIIIYLSGLIGTIIIFCDLWLFIELFKEGFHSLQYGGNTGLAWGVGFLVSISLTLFPVFLFLVFFTRPKIKEQFR